MRKMNRILCTLCLALFTISMACAQTKVLEKSAKKMPEWLITQPDGYMIVSVTGKTMEDVQRNAQAEITERIILAVASNVSVSTKSVLSDENVNGNVTSKNDFTRTSKINSAYLPFLADITLSDAEEIYWVKVQDKKTKESSYEYSVKYPFSDARRKALLAEFNRIDGEKSAQLEALTQKINEIEHIDEIKSAITQLETLEEYFFDDVRISQTKGLQTRYKELYNNITITGMFVAPGRYQCQVLLSGNPVNVSSVPTVKSNCAGQLQATPSDGRFIISYDTADCLPEEENVLDIQFKINGKKYKHQAYLSEAGGAAARTEFSVVPVGKLVLTADASDTEKRTITNLNIRLSLNNRSDMPFGLKSVELNVPEISAPIVFDDVDAVFTTKGVFQVKLLAEGEFKLLEVRQSFLSLIEGAITFVNPETGVIERKKLSLPYVTNWK